MEPVLGSANVVWVWKCLGCDDHREKDGLDFSRPANCAWCGGANFDLAGARPKDPDLKHSQDKKVVEFAEIQTCEICKNEISPSDDECEKCGMPLAPN